MHVTLSLKHLSNPVKISHKLRELVFFNDDDDEQIDFIQITNPWPRYGDVISHILYIICTIDY